MDRNCFWLDLFGPVRGTIYSSGWIFFLIIRPKFARNRFGSEFGNFIRKRPSWPESDIVQIQFLLQSVIFDQNSKYWGFSPKLKVLIVFAKMLNWVLKMTDFSFCDRKYLWFYQKWLLNQKMSQIPCYSTFGTCHGN